MTYLAVPISAKNLDQAVRQVKAALAAGAEMLELRTDYIENLSVDLVNDLIRQTRNAAGKSLPIIVTCRDKQQGGAIDYPQQLRADVLIAAINARVEYVDLEYENFIKPDVQRKIKAALSRSLKTRLILSAHNFIAKFADIKKLYRDISTACPQAIPKLVYTANHIDDCFEAFDLLHQAGGERIIFCMGEAGLISRILAKKLDSFVTFASIDEQSATAPGQLTVGQLKGLYRFDWLTRDTELFGVIAEPVAHSLSPAIHNACFGQMNMNKLYLPLLVQGGRQGFDSFIDNILAREWLNFGGFSVTIPHKENALNYVLQRKGFIEPLAEKIGAVNTIVVTESRVTDNKSRLSAYNTDYSAALDAITKALGIGRAELKDMPVAIIGAGGVARAIVAGLSDVGAKVKIYNRTVERAEKLAAEFDCDFAGLPLDFARGGEPVEPDDLQNLNAKLLINCTSIGMHPNVDEAPLLKKYIKKNMVVFDTVYTPAETLLLRNAKEAGARTIDGLSMFINQAMAQFKLFTGQEANPDLMRNVICDYISNK